MSGIESGAIGAAALKLGAQATLGMLGAAVLYFFMPPEDPKNGAFNRREFAARLAVAGLFSTVFGDWCVAVVQGLVPALQAASHPAPFWLAAGAPGWWVSRAVALYIYNRKDKDAKQIIDEVRQ